MTDCLFCELIQKKANLLYEDEKVIAMLAPDPVVIGQVVVLPRVHAPIIESVPDFIVGDMFKVANKVSSAIFEALSAQGTNILVQNGPPAGQRHNHAMVSIIPRFENDNLPIGWQPKPADEGVLGKLEGQIKDEAKMVGVFEREKPKPIEQAPPKEFSKESAKGDERIKRLRRIP